MRHAPIAPSTDLKPMVHCKTLIHKSATIVASELIGIKDEAGNIEVGKWADILAMKGNPLEDVTVLQKVDFVMKDGKIHKSNIK